MLYCSFKERTMLDMTSLGVPPAAQTQVTAPSAVLVLYVSATLLSGDSASPCWSGESQKWAEGL